MINAETNAEANAETNAEANAEKNAETNIETNAEKENVLDVVDLKMRFPVRRGLLRRMVAEVKAIDGVSFSIKPGETLGLVGESGCGKTTLGRCIIRLYKPTEGLIMFEGQAISQRGKSELGRFRRRMSMVFQDPYGSLNPRMSSGDIVREPLEIHKLVDNRKEYKERVAELFTMVGLSPDMMDRYPHEFSGGQRQRLSVARALAGDPSLLICDEPISALDVSMQAQVLNLFGELQARKKNLSYLFISHDLLAVQYISQRVAVMYLGRIVELASSADLYSGASHPYSKALLSAQPRPDPFIEETRDRIILEGDVPTPLNPPAGCSFHPRCAYSTARCEKETPELRDVASGHFVACHRV